MKTEPLTIDILGEPPTIDHLALMRIKAIDIKKQARYRLRIFTILCISIAITYLLAPVFLKEHALITPEMVAYIYITFFSGCMAGLILSATYNDNNEIAGILLGLSFLAVMLIFIPESNDPYSKIMNTFVYITPTAASFILSNYYFKQIDSLATYSKKLITDLCELDAEDEDFQDECIAYEKLCQTFPEVKTYQSKVVSMKRRPVLAEYKSAINFRNTEIMRKGIREKEIAAEEKTKEARAACQRMMSIT